MSILPAPSASTTAAWFRGIVSSIVAPVAAARYALSGSASRAIFPGSLVGIMLIRSVLPACSAGPDFEHAGAASAIAAPSTTRREMTECMAVGYHGVDRSAALG